jgi:4,5-DOPA dioxygenase extradiol
VLRHLFPDADVPVFLVGVDMTAPPETHLALGRGLGELREEGVLLMGSGNIVHNLYEADFDDMDAPPDPLGVAFDRAVARAVEDEDLVTLTDYPSLGEAAAFSVPTADHYLPMLYAVGARRAGESLRFFNEIFQNRTVSMRSFIIG